MTIEDYNSKFIWPKTSDLETIQVGSSLYKADRLLSEIEYLITQRKAWAPITGSTKRVEPINKLEPWIEEQNNKKKSYDAIKGTSLGVVLDLDQFPDTEDEMPKKIITTSRNIAYLIDDMTHFILALNNAYGVGQSQKAQRFLNISIGVFLYVTNSVESGGRAFSGDPFTGQAASYSRIFAHDLLGVRVLNFIAYYPHQLYSQFFDASGNIPNNKGVKMLRSQANLIITAGGVLIDPKNWRVIE